LDEIGGQRIETRARKLVQSTRFVLPLPKGYWYPPSFSSPGVTASHRIAQEKKIFGPVLSVMDLFALPEGSNRTRQINTPYGLRRRRLDGLRVAKIFKDS